MRKLAVVVVPVYRKFMPSEAFAFAQCLNVLGRYDISLLHPAGFDVSDIVRTASRTIGHVAMDDQWFRSIDSYNALCLSADFYDAYAAYEYMLIYQLDAYAFRDELADWCARGYDYIGARGCLTIRLTNARSATPCDGCAARSTPPARHRKSPTPRRTIMWATEDSACGVWRR